MSSDIKTLFGEVVSPRFHDSFFMGKYGHLETLRASKYGRRFSVVIVDIGIEATNHDEETFKFVERLVSRFLDILRESDILGSSGVRRLVVILPETDYLGSLMVVRKLSKAIEGLSATRHGIRLMFSSASFPRDGNTYGEVLGVSIRRLSQKSSSSWETLGFKGRLFWEAVEELSKGDFKGFDSANFEAGEGKIFPIHFLDGINELIFSEVISAPWRKGILYHTPRNVSDLELIKRVSLVDELSTSVFLIASEHDKTDIRNTVRLIVDDPRLKETFFTLFLNEDSGYALVCKEGWGSSYSCFHSSDPFLVEGLIAKLQNEYSLQERL